MIDLVCPGPWNERVISATPPCWKNSNRTECQPAVSEIVPEFSVTACVVQVVDDLHVVDPQPDAVVAGGEECPVAGGAGFDEAGPADRVVVVGGDGGARRGGAPVGREVDRGVDPRGREPAREIGRVEVLADQAVLADSTSSF